MPSMSHVVPMLLARDLAETERFYIDQLGFLVTNRIAGEHGRPQFIFLLRGAAAILFSAAGRDEPLLMTGALYFYPRDIQAEWERLKDRVPVIRPLARTPFGLKEFAIRDCNGYELRYGQEA